MTYPLLFSIYYPHDQKCRLVKWGILPLLAGNDFNTVNFFFSNYKGENITMYLSNGNKARGEKLVKDIKDSMDSFFDEHKAKALKMQLPLNQLFMDFPYNSIYFWERDPFKTAEATAKLQNPAAYYHLLSMHCLKRLSLENRWDDAATFKIFLELLMVLNIHFRLKYHIEAMAVFKELIEAIKRRAGDKGYLIDVFLQQGQDIYRQERLAIHDTFNSIKNQIIGETDLVQNRVEDWLEIIHLKQKTEPGQIQNVTSWIIMEIILDISSRIDLSQKGLIQAVGLVSMMKE
ncbi:hypothetical protein QQ020_00865 [Fulvivirgaceae bacterium BMA12]|uniref:Uncharacterized protein n=1 Tax=Agaribacillus aureus TaxID=3051825 RepID=A0ABT8L0I4_9BACT|nr:hypothetical protein [Fulvivirgaceae bacterium BMA12]